MTQHNSSYEWKNRIVGYRVVKASELADNPMNWRKHPAGQVAAMRGVLGSVGWVGAAIYNVRTQRLIDGHLRKGLGPDVEIPVLDVDISEDEEKIILATYDPITALAEADKEELEALLRDLEVDPELQDMLDDLAESVGIDLHDEEVAEDAGAQVDRAAELQAEWGTELGQLWEIPSKTGTGVHRVICGDCTDAEVVESLMGGVKAELILTDPPYGINVVKNVGATVGGSKPVTIGSIRGRRKYPFGGVKNMGTVGSHNMVDATPYRPVHGDDKPFDPSHLIDMADNLILFGGNYFASKLDDSRCWIVWDKNNTGNFADAELAWTSFDKSVKLYHFTWNGLVRQGDRKLEGVKRFHPTQKPVGLFSEILEDFSESGNTIMDVYLGSGTTLIAAEQTGRICYGCEIDPGYIAVILQRARDLGLEPELVVDEAGAQLHPPTGMGES